MITETLADVASAMPTNRLFNHAQFARAELIERRGDLPTAAKLYSSLVGKDSSSLAIRAAFNAAMISIHLGDYSKACFHLDIVVNGAQGHELHIESLLLLGRLLLDRGQSQEAVFQLRRATEARSHTVRQARAAALLGMAFLMQEKYKEAAEAIHDNKNYFEDTEARNVAAFVTSFARWQSVTGEMQMREATFLYRSLASVNADADWIGQSGRLLFGRAMAELGFDDRMAELYRQTIAGGATDNVETEMSFALANYEMTRNQADSAIQRWMKLTSNSSPRWVNRARLRLAEVCLDQGQASECLQHCEFIKSADGIIRTDLSKLMGRAYEKLGEDELAARSYAGQLPKF